MDGGVAPAGRRLWRAVWKGSADSRLRRRTCGTVSRRGVTALERFRHGRPAHGVPRRDQQRGKQRGVMTLQWLPAMRRKIIRERDSSLDL
ncbi:hypothetical protein Scep_014529 [Stephania cephalantha]|uniref:Uncharacterized protein n=1 Tax=Stephania cephalantha TaxID=152367 RepID=A0AAP0J1H4_9MAGN